MIHIVLVGPEGPENIGAVSRSMLNMNVNSLLLVRPGCDHLSKAALAYSVHAHEVLQTASVFDSLESALKGADISIAVSRRIGQFRRQDYTLPGLPNLLKNYTEKEVYLVFGREKTGLTNEELASCDLICSIPSAPEFPSLNLAQAVMVTLYELYSADERARLENPVRIASREDFDGMLSEIITSLEELNYFKHVPTWRLENYLKKVLLRAKLDTYDTMVIRNLFTRIRGMVGRTLGKNKKTEI